MYRILFLVFVCCCVIKASSQIPFVEQQDTAMQLLDKQCISTGALYDRVFPWAELVSYTDSLQIDYKDVRQAWHELYLAALFY